jgi:predicted DnaQ family exonuclease/DinG family helicase
MNAVEYAALDVEATGLEPSRHEVIEVGVVVFDAEGISREYQTFVRPRRPVPLEITRLTGIADADVAGAPRLRDVEEAIRQAVGRRPIVGHNIGFDLEMLAGGGVAFPNVPVDTLALSRLLVPGLPSYSLGNVAAALGVVDEDPAHRALDDARRTAVVMQRLLARVADIDEATRLRIAGLLDGTDRGAATVFTAVRGGGGSLEQSPEFRFQGVIRRPDPLRRTGSTAPVEPKQVKTFFAAGGPIAAALPRFTHRSGQSRMAAQVTRALNENRISLIEAGTGTGKSMAYLAPTALHAIERGERVIVSTNTVALQDQLLEKDIPDLKVALTEAGVTTELRASVLKGRSNYLCLRRWFNDQRTNPATPADAALRGRVILWLRETQTGDRSELPMNADEEGAFRRVSAEGESCNAAKCVYQQRNQCFLYRARREAESSHIVVVNHALLLTDAAGVSKVLPESERLIIDEAHHLEDQATKQFGFAISDASVGAALDDALREEGPTPGGAVGMAADLLAKRLHEAPGGRAAASKALLDHVTSTMLAVREAKTAAHTFFDIVGQMLTQQTLRLTDTVRGGREWTEVMQLGDRLAERLRAIDSGMRWFVEQVQPIAEAEASDLDIDDAGDVLMQLQNAQLGLAEVRVNLHEVVLQPDPAGIYWAEKNFFGRVSLNAAPLHVGALLEERLFSRMSTTVLTSATITTSDSFEFIEERLGIRKADTFAVAAPFDYQKAALVFVADDIPEPNQPGYQQAVEKAIISLARGVGGRTLVLFTSHQALRQTYEAIKPALERDGIAVLGQRIDGGPKRLIERLRDGDNCIVLGAATFWEGVDVAGPALSALAIVKLPFAVPTDPIVSARSELYDNAFADYSVPQAILRFKQGFGRLIRSSEDVGVCAILDRRVVSKRYGRQFLESLPQCEVTIAKSSSLGDTAGRWLTQAGGGR